jgi:hypothetical protein
MSVVRMAWLGDDFAADQALRREAREAHPGDEWQAEVDRLVFLAGRAGYLHQDDVDSLAMRAGGPTPAYLEAMSRIEAAAQAAA